MQENNRDYIVTLSISEKGLAEGKRPPLCDGCSEPIPKDAKDGNYSLNALILDGDFFHSIQCDNCIPKYFGKMPRRNEQEVPKEIRQTIRLSMSREMAVFFQ